MNKINYQKELEKIINKNIQTGEKPTLLLHGCCAPCSSYVLEYLSEYFHITELFYNPNIFPKSEFEHRSRELERLIKELKPDGSVNLIIDNYDPDEFFECVRGMENEREGGERCFKCYELRLRRAALVAKEQNFDYFTTTLSISPLKNAEKLNEIGKLISKEYGVEYLPSDFKKKNGYKRSIELSAEYNLYRQNFCGCVYSKRQAEVKL